MALSDAEIARIESLLRERAGLELTRWLVEARVEARAQARKLSLSQYASLVSRPEGGSELEALIEAVRVGETRFFRHQSHVEAVRDVVVPSWKLRGVMRPKVWSAGCATGEEPYTLALVICAAARGTPLEPEILATDVSSTAIRRGEAGRYPRSALAQIPAEHHQSFAMEPEHIVARPELRARVTFQEENLATDDRARRADLVFCRNVLIYFDPEVRARVLAKLVRTLTPGGFLFLGYSETLRDVPGLRAVPCQGQVLWEKAIPALDARRSSTSEAARSSGSVPSPASTSRAAPAPQRERAKTAATFRVSQSTGADLQAPLDAAIRAAGLSELTLDLDAATFLDDDVAPVLRRAQKTAEALGVRLVLRATRVGPQRWLRRHGLGDDA